MHCSKRKRSSLSSRQRKASRPIGGNFIHTPFNKDDLGDIQKCKQGALHAAMGVDKNQFLSFTNALRILAKDVLDVTLSWDNQDVHVRTRFLQKVHNQHPEFRTKYEDGWPVQVYVRRYLGNASKAPKQRQRRELEHPSRDELRRKPTLPNMQSYIPKPQNLDKLLDATELELCQAMEFDDSQFKSMKSLLQELASRFLDINALYEEQDRHQLRRLVQEASKAQPLFSTKFEGAWPIHLYIKQYLRKRVHENLSTRAARGQSSTSHPMSMEVSAGCMYRYPPIAPTNSQLTWSPANFSPNSPSSAPTPSMETSDTGEGHISLFRARVHNSLSSNICSTCHSGNKENTPLPAHPAVDETSAPVKEFLRSLSPNLEHLLPLFRGLGIEDLETLLAFKTWSIAEREELMRGHLNKLQLLAVQNFLKKAN